MTSPPPASPVSPASPSPPPGGGSGPEADRQARRAALVARIAEPDLDRTPLQLPSVGSGSGMPAVPVTRAGPGAGPVRTGAERRFERVAIPATVLAGFSLLACAVVGVAMLIGWSGIVPLVLLLVLGVGFVGLSATAVRAGALARKDTSSRPAVVWQSSQPWLGPLASSPERRLVGVACQAVGRIVAAPAWGTSALDDHRLTLDLVAELDQIDAQAYELALARRAAGGPAWPAAEPPGAAGGPAPWLSLLDHVAALEDYARAVSAAAIAGGQGLSELGRAATAGSRAVEPAEGAELRERRLAAGSVSDEFSIAQLRQLTAELDQRSTQG